MTPKWYLIAQGEIGTKEAPGFLNNPDVQKYYSKSGIGKQPDSVPWCMAFVNWCLETSGMKGTRLLAARSALTLGKHLDRPSQGCIVVFQRGNSPWQGHVAFFVRTNPDGTIRVLGGNQSDKVSYGNYSQKKVLGYRWPTEEIN